ncbi:MAG: sulfatase-like hydrolase/transferase [Saprospiraceae bacterium]
MMPLRKSFLILFALMIFSSCQQRDNGKSEQKNDARPNIIVVLVDDMRWDEYAAAGHPYLQTPNIDRISREGINFKQAFATTPLCSPSRASFLTGLYPHSNGITDNLARNEQSHQLETFPKRLNAEGYETAFIGKWHMGNDNSRRPGFDEWVALKGQGEAINPFLNINGAEQTIEGYVTDILTARAVQFINRERSAPFLLYLSHKGLHPNHMQRDDGSSVAIEGGGFIAADRHKGMYSTAVFNRRPNSGIVPTDKPALMRPIEGLPPLGPEIMTTETTIRERGEMLMAIDEGLGDLLAALEKKGELNKTIVVFTSDHGYWYGEHCLDKERRLAYEEGIRIPLLMRYPEVIRPGTKTDEMVLSIDLAPTLLEMAGVTPDKSLQGMSLMPIIKNNFTAWRNAFLIEYYTDTVMKRIVNMGYKAVRSERYKYIHYLDLKDMDELYDLQEDPYELKNIINEPGKEALLSDMKQLLNELLVKTGDAAIPNL